MKYIKLIALATAVLLLLTLLPAMAEEHLQISGLEYQSSMELRYAAQFAVDYYSGGYKLLSIGDGNRYLLIPEGEKAPEALEPSIKCIYQPVDRAYLAATSAMALFDALDALDVIRLSGTAESGWYVENAAAAMRSGDILFAGKYSEPDYETMVNEGCDLAIESTMILHSPKVIEMIELLGIPVFIENSSYEEHPMGRAEWIKLYGAMLNREEEAEAFFNRQAETVQVLEKIENTGKTVAFFYVSSDGSVVVHKSGGYVPRMIEIAGGKYIFDDLSDPDSNRSSVSLTMEEFYASAIDADFLIYNATIDNQLNSVAELLTKSELFADFKAVKEGNVWCTGKYLYQATDITGSVIEDIHNLITGDEGDFTFVYKLN